MILEVAINFVVLLATFLCAKKIILCWPLWMLAGLGWWVLFAENHLWAMFAFEFVWQGMNGYGWYKWAKGRNDG